MEPQNDSLLLAANWLRDKMITDPDVRAAVLLVCEHRGYDGFGDLIDGDPVDVLRLYEGLKDMIDGDEDMETYDRKVVDGMRGDRE